MATANRIPTFGFGASVAAVLLFGFGGLRLDQTGQPDVCVLLPGDSVVVQLPADDVAVQLPADDEGVQL